MVGDPEAMRVRRRSTCLWLLKVHRLQVAAFGERLSEAASRTLSPGGYQEILLELYLAGLDSRHVYQSCLAPTEPPATIHRQAARLETLGAVSRAHDNTDHRRLNVALTSHMQGALDQFIDAVEAALRDHFSGLPDQ